MIPRKMGGEVYRGFDYNYSIKRKKNFNKKSKRNQFGLASDLRLCLGTDILNMTSTFP